MIEINNQGPDEEVVGQLTSSEAGPTIRPLALSPLFLSPFSRFLAFFGPVFLPRFSFFCSSLRYRFIFFSRTFLSLRLFLSLSPSAYRAFVKERFGSCILFTLGLFFLVTPVFRYATPGRKELPH